MWINQSLNWILHVSNTNWLLDLPCNYQKHQVPLQCVQSHDPPLIMGHTTITIWPCTRTNSQLFEYKTKATHLECHSLTTNEDIKKNIAIWGNGFIWWTKNDKNFSTIWNTKYLKDFFLKKNHNFFLSYCFLRFSLENLTMHQNKLFWTHIGVTKCHKPKENWNFIMHW